MSLRPKVRLDEVLINFEQATLNNLNKAQSKAKIPWRIFHLPEKFNRKVWLGMFQESKLEFLSASKIVTVLPFENLEKKTSPLNLVVEIFEKAWEKIVLDHREIKEIDDFVLFPKYLKKKNLGESSIPQH